MTRILVTGARGLLGSSLVPYLRACGHDVVSLTRGPEGDVSADLTDAEEVARALEAVSPSVIVNLAALTDVDECERNPQLAYRSNVKIVSNLAHWIRESASSACHLVQLSTDQVYDGEGPHTEDDLTLSNYYGFSKYTGDLVAGTVASTVVRTNFFGPSRSPDRTSLSDWLVNGLTNGTPLTLFEDVSFSPLSLGYLVQLLELVITTRQSGIYNVGSKDGMSKADFAFALADALSLPTLSMSRGSSTTLALTAYRPKNMCMDSSSFERAFSVKLPSLSEEIRSMTAAYSHDA